MNDKEILLMRKCDSYKTDRSRKDTETIVKTTIKILCLDRKKMVKFLPVLSLLLNIHHLTCLRKKHSTHY